MRVIVLSLVMLGCLAGCGLKGPLYIPTPAQERESAERERRLQEREREAEQAQQPAQGQKQQAVPPDQSQPK